MDVPDSKTLPPRRVYGIGVLTLGIGNLLYGIGQFIAGQQLPLLSLVQLVMGVTLVGIGGLVLTSSDRLSPPDLSPRALLAIGAVGVVVGLYLALAGLALLLS